jgi:A/G-specific adenine glycosylase
LVAWFENDHRPMPWREDSSPYRVWISEIMLQQTQVTTVIPYFERFLARFPDVQALAAADPQDVLRLWEGLGYYSRARNLHKAAREIVASRNGRLPETHDDWLTLPGIGDYTAAAIASIAFGEPVPSVDGNVLRVCARLWAIRDPIRDARVVSQVRERLRPLIRTVNPSSFNQAMMETGALVCRPRNPACEACVLRRDCQACRGGLTAELPVVHRAAAVPHHVIAAGVIWKAGRVLIARRRDDQMLGGLWEFPGGKQEPGETLPETARREVFEETGLRVRVGNPILTVRHAYSHFRITLTAFHCKWISGRPTPRTSAELKWIAPGELKDYPFPRANRRIGDLVAREGRALAIAGLGEARRPGSPTVNTAMRAGLTQLLAPAPARKTARKTPVFHAKRALIGDLTSTADMLAVAEGEGHR